MDWMDGQSPSSFVDLKQHLVGTTRTSRWCLHLLRSGKFRQFRGEQSQQSHVLAQLKANGYSRCTNSLGKNSKPWQDESKFTKDVAFFVVHHLDWLRPWSFETAGEVYAFYSFHFYCFRDLLTDGARHVHVLAAANGCHMTFDLCEGLWNSYCIKSWLDYVFLRHSIQAKKLWLAWHREIQVLLLQGIAWYHYCCFGARCSILLLTPLLDLWFDCHGFSIASYLRQEASQRAQKLTKEVSSTCMRGGKSLKLNMAPIIRHQEVIQEKKHPRNISRCCVSFRVCILHASHFKLHIDNSPWPSRRISNTMSLCPWKRWKGSWWNHWASLSTLTTWSTGTI